MRPLLLLALVTGSAAFAQDDWLGPDKALHFSASAAIAGAGYGGALLLDEPPWVRLAVGASLALSAGVGKELADLAGLGQPSWRDLAWDVAGMAVGLLASWLVDHFVLTPLRATRGVRLRPELLAPSR